MLRTAAAVGVASLLVLGCERVENDGDRELSPAAGQAPAVAPPDSPAAPGPQRGLGADLDTASCTNEETGYRVDYPAAWHTNRGDVMPACSLFDPQPIEIAPATELPHDIAVAIRHEPVAFQQIVEAPGRREVSREDTEVDGRPAIRLESLAEEPAMLPPGTRSYRYFVDLNGATLVAAAHDLGEPDFTTKRQTLDRIMGSLRFTTAR